MSQKRKRPEKKSGLAPGEKLKHSSLPQASSSTPWGWVGTEAFHVDEITSEHRLSTCNFCQRNKQPHCRNIYASSSTTQAKHAATSSTAVQGELDDDVIVISDTEEDLCSKKSCKSNPFCLNYLGQDKWEDEAKAQKRFLEMVELGNDPANDSRKEYLPVGLKNLGATCYANASLQVWFRDLAFRAGVYACEPPEGMPEDKFKDSPVFHLQSTFASLQCGNRSVFNPIKLVESLQLRTTEQQDAQEFSKLFMSHLDAEFKKQSSPELQSLIPDQFQGTQVYGTLCSNCQNRSERSSDFLEIEISFNKNCILEDCIKASLAPESLSGDNRYFCSRCSSLQDATRYTELRTLPPVLHFSLLRFVYDVSTMERKKSKHSVSFPATLDMGPFMGTTIAGSDSGTKPSSNHVYELRGVLLHKGASAYHGHYEAQVKDSSNNEWFQFNDDVITSVKGFVPPSKDGQAEEQATGKGQVRKNRTNARKRRRVEDSDEEQRPETSQTVDDASASTQKISITSRDAYMLIYARKDLVPLNGVSSPMPKPQPPDRVMKVIAQDNNVHDEACKLYTSRKQEYISQFRTLRNEIRDIYCNWEATSLEDCHVLSRQALENYLAETAISVALRPSDPEQLQSGQDNRHVLHLDDIVCEHGCLDPSKARDMKLVRHNSISRIEKVTKCVLVPLLKPSDVCVLCVASDFQEKYYEIRHPIDVKTFDDVSPVPEDEPAVWISKKWCREWRSSRPRIHDPETGDLPPDAPEFLNHVQCEHGGLSLNIVNRRRISQQAAAFLSGLFPTWKPITSDSEICALCEAEVHISKEDKKEIRKQIEEEKARLKFLYEPTLDLWTEQSAPCAVLPLHFVKQWKRWIGGHAGNDRPDGPDNTSLLCEHKKLIFDPNCPSDTDSIITVIPLADWNAIQAIYPCGPLISLTKVKDATGETIYDSDVPTCTDCRLKWKTDWVETEIEVRMQGHQQEPGELPLPSKSRVAPSRGTGARQSRRLRQIRANVERRRIPVKKSTTVKDIKIALNSEFSIPTICQRLYYQGKELEDNTVTVSSLNILANDILDLREAEEVVEIDTDSDETPATKRRREEGQGFGGTLLGGENAPASSKKSQIENACPICTFVNVATAVVCEMCDSTIE